MGGLCYRDLMILEHRKWEKSKKVMAYPKNVAGGCLPGMLSTDLRSEE